MDWHGYPQHPDAHPERPWWRWVSTGLRRTDLQEARYGGHIDEWAARALAEAERIDREHPLPAPEPRCGQVWVRPNGPGRGARLVRSVLGDERDGAIYIGENVLRFDLWPPRGAVLVAGPGAPWAPLE